MSWAGGIARLWSLRVFAVTGDSMEPSFRSGDYLLVDRRGPLARRPARGAVVVVRDPRDRGQLYLKRVVGLPGEELALEEGAAYVNGVHLPEPYLGGLPASPGLEGRSWRLGTDEYLVLGDNRAHSTDSRQFGPLGRDLILGRAWLRCWPPARWAALR